MRATLDLSASYAGLIVLTYGVGFGAAGLSDGWLDRLHPDRVFRFALLTVAAFFGLMVPEPAAFGSMLLLTGAWGFANHLALNALILLLARARPEQCGALLGLNSAVTYRGVLVGVGAAVAIYGHAGFAPVAGVAASLVTAAAVLAQTAFSRKNARGSFPARGC